MALPGSPAPRRAASPAKRGFRALSGLATQFFLKDSLGLEPAAIQSLLATAALPWSVKPLYGLVSDAVPIRGQHRKPYLVLAAAVGLAAWSGLAGLT
ncbi:hypothetical protein EMIHUDRAFT_256863 [Emiliania huxleyi CCMP1516]|uniref:MFS transporter n=2 Tax=Emiliania huxleyi TaxID=2903 RepID=A0A0D3IQ15_EMIH1|nr:hypothetical protein EMIHUDRAFT_256863 [Emiliania huxleyi CCMP1516]EOD13350.1 hypothetical protein EMIHUDRAFT_256863 [Emiliania huxleyi CCMP1516]|eukprot:XP_005765779.1 hypothetical protein EMIHUDRAFT_256863 [Emiliania huxleyi CCMP1516]